MLFISELTVSMRFFSFLNTIFSACEFNFQKRLHIFIKYSKMFICRSAVFQKKI